MMEQQLRQAVVDASRRGDVARAVDALYRDLQEQIDQRKPVCIVSGRCCKFEEFGHRLYVTTLELAAFAAQLPAHPSTAGQARRGTEEVGCPFQIGKLCGVHAIRPFGCRVFFCDSTAQEWQQEQYAIFHARLKALHERLAVPYFYVEWRAGLKALAIDSQ